MISPEGSRGLVVLVVDPDNTSLNDLAEILRSDSRVAEVVAASDATETLRIVNQLASKGSPMFDVIYLDIRMPGLDGFELALVFSTLPIPPSIVFVTSQDDRAVEAYEIGAEDYLLKPVGPGRLQASLDRVIERRQYLYVSDELVSGPGQVFLCHSSGDKEQVRELWGRLSSDGVSCWFDETALLPGQEWELEIQSAIRASQYVLACLSGQSINRRGYLQRELKFALDVADEQPEGATFLIPVRLEPCVIPQRLRRWQWVDLFVESGYERLLLALKAR